MIAALYGLLNLYAFIAFVWSIGGMNDRTNRYPPYLMLSALTAAGLSQTLI